MTTSAHVAELELKLSLLRRSYCLPAQAADLHILMVDRGHMDNACQLAASLVMGTQTPRLVKILLAIVDERVRYRSLAAHPQPGLMDFTMRLLVLHHITLEESRDGPSQCFHDVANCFPSLSLILEGSSL